MEIKGATTRINDGRTRILSKRPCGRTFSDDQTLLEVDVVVHRLDYASGVDLRERLRLRLAVRVLAAAAGVGPREHAEHLAQDQPPVEHRQPLREDQVEEVGKRRRAAQARLPLRAHHAFVEFERKQDARVWGR